MVAYEQKHEMVYRDESGTLRAPATVLGGVVFIGNMTGNSVNYKILTKSFRMGSSHFYTPRLWDMSGVIVLASFVCVSVCLSVGLSVSL